MKSQRATPQASQMAFDIFALEPSRVSINSTATVLGRSHYDDQVPAANKRNSGSELSAMVVDDRVLSQGITTWRNLIDFAIRTGHTELFASEDDRQGLRRPGFRYAPINRLPERGPEYVKDVLAGQLATRLEQKGAQFASGRMTGDETFKAQVVLDGSTFQISVYEGRKLDANWSFKYMDLPRTAGLQADDDKARVAFISRKIKRIQREGRIAAGDAQLIAQAVIRGVHSVLKDAEGAK